MSLYATVGTVTARNAILASEYNTVRYTDYHDGTGGEIK